MIHFAPYSCFPDQLITIDDGLSLYVPVPEMIKPIYYRLVNENASTPFPFWAKIWPASKAMSAFLRMEPQWIIGKKVLEIGAGIGLPSFSIAHLAREVIVTDHAPSAIELINKNINHLCINNLEAICLDWNDFPLQVRGDTVLLSDVNYDPDAYGPLLKLILTMIDDGTVIIIATPERIMAIPFVDALQKFIKHHFLHTVEDMDQLIEIRMILLWK